MEEENGSGWRWVSAQNGGGGLLVVDVVSNGSDKSQPHRRLGRVQVAGACDPHRGPLIASPVQPLCSLVAHEMVAPDDTCQRHRQPPKTGLHLG